MITQFHDTTEPPYFELILDSIRPPKQSEEEFALLEAAVRLDKLQERTFLERETTHDGIRDESALLSVLHVGDESRLVLTIAARLPKNKGRNGLTPTMFGRFLFLDGWYLELKSIRPHPVDQDATQAPFLFAMPVAGWGAIAYGVVDNTTRAATLRLALVDGTVFEEPFRDGSALLFVRPPAPEAHAGYAKVAILDREGQELHAGRLNPGEP